MLRETFAFVKSVKKMNSLMNRTTQIGPDQRFCRLLMVDSVISEDQKVYSHKSVGIQVDCTEEDKKTQKKTWILLLLLLLLLACAVAEAVVFLLEPRRCDKSVDVKPSASIEYQTTDMHKNSTDKSTLFGYSISNQHEKASQTTDHQTKDVRTTLTVVSTPSTAIETSLNVQTSTNTEYQTTDLQTTVYVPLAQRTTIGSRGRSFLVLFTPDNFGDTTKNVYITSEHGVQMNISTSSHLNVALKAQIDRVTNVSSVEHIRFPSVFELGSFKREFRSAIIETSADVFVISHDDADGSVGSTTHIPIQRLSNKYLAISIKPTDGGRSQLALASIKDRTMINITFNMEQNSTLVIKGKTFIKGDIFTLHLDRFETYLIEHDSDLTGTIIESSDPIAVFSGNDCIDIDLFGFCDHLVEQLPPLTSVDNTYIVPPNSDNRDTLIRISAIDDSVFTYTIDRIAKTVTVKMLETFQTKIKSHQTCLVESNHSIFVTSFGLHSKTSVLGDPSMTIVPGVHQYLDYYKIVVPSGYAHNYVSIMMKHSSKDSLRINGNVIHSTDIFFEENVTVGQEKYIIRSINLPEGEISVYSMNGDRFGLMFAGVTTDEAYGFTGNSLLI